MLHQFTKVEFHQFKAFRSFTLRLRHFNILVGPNNAGKSTILASFRILAAGMRKASQRKPIPLSGPNGRALGYIVDLNAISVAEENIFYNYDDSEAASVTFSLSNNNSLKLYFPERGTCYLFADDSAGHTMSPSNFRANFQCSVGFVPILGPVEHNERLYEKEAARLALFSYLAARNFRNIWHHYPEHFETFRKLLQETWPGMDIEPPTVDTSHEKPVMHMFCPEERIPREIFWSGFGFQVWCQMLTHIVQSNESSLFIIDEPDIYLHSDLQRQLVGILRSLGPDILIATHSTEIISEAEPDDIVLVDKNLKSGRRLKDPGELGGVFAALGSNLNPVLTQLAKTRRAVFVEGKDFQILGKLARKLNISSVGNRRAFAVIPVGGFNPDRIRTLRQGIETTLGGSIAAAALLDRDYRSSVECENIKQKCKKFCDLIIIHECKEIENLILVPQALDRAAKRRVADRATRTGGSREYSSQVASILEDFADQQKSYVMSQHLAYRRRFERDQGSGRDEAQANQAALEEFEAEWKIPQRRLELLPGKEALAFVNRALQESYSVSITPSGIIDAMTTNEIPPGIKLLLRELSHFANAQATATG